MRAEAVTRWEAIAPKLRLAALPGSLRFGVIKPQGGTLQQKLMRVSQQTGVMQQYVGTLTEKELFYICRRFNYLF